MTVVEMIEQLSQFPNDALVLGPLPNGDPDWHACVNVIQMDMASTEIAYVPASTAPNEKVIRAVVIKT